MVPSVPSTLKTLLCTKENLRREQLPAARGTLVRYALFPRFSEIIAGWSKNVNSRRTHTDNYVIMSVDTKVCLEWPNKSIYDEYTSVLLF